MWTGVKWWARAVATSSGPKKERNGVVRRNRDVRSRKLSALFSADGHKAEEVHE